MKVLLTGGSGFLGGILTDTLQKDHELFSLGRSSSNTISCDLSKQIPEIPEIDMIIHSAGKAHVIPKSPEEEQEFFSVNSIGTSNLLKGIKKLPKLMVLISTVAVYGLDEGVNIDENQALNGTTPYAKSKIQAEEIWKSWALSNNVDFLILRLPLIAGPNPPGNLGAMIKAIEKGYYFRMGDGQAKKSVVLARDIAEHLPKWIGHSGVYNLTDGIHPSLKDLDSYLSHKYGKKVCSISEGLLGLISKIGDVISVFPFNSYRHSKLKSTLTFSDLKARRELAWSPKPVIGNF
ncbi:NAD-dependent epimerase/dehydratase family protein [Algoriphagus formosus]|uniref:NAD(P)-dependent oxidoreductase n=1 Tax=Algoriphagus formosus TaxID=2007308 RepID=A0A4R5V6W8_9BACT|nr:NAD(P)-dependent oxidoreductase [Algoriphagus aquimaris]TDK47345.1 NAD(P)-dependent oxidoreductase [Algoriphagus aquimaris]